MEHSLNIVHTESSCGWGGQEMQILSVAIELPYYVPKKAPLFEQARIRKIPVASLPIAKITNIRKTKEF